jgi:integrase
VWSRRDRKPIRKTFATVSEALEWRQEAQVALRRGTLRGPSALTIDGAAEEWLAAADAGVVRTRSGTAYKPSALRSYRQVLNGAVVPVFGRLRLTALTTNMLQDFVDRAVAAGQSPSTIRNTLLPLRAIYRRALQRGEVAVNPTLRLQLPAVPARRERVARADEAAALIDAIPPGDRALWATALYSGLRRGELQALCWSDVDFEQNLIHVRQAWDSKAGLIEPKSRSGRRRVPLTQALRRHLLAHRLRQGGGGSGFVFANGHGRPFDPGTVLSRARKAWRENGLESLTLHDCRHTYAAYMIAAGINTKALSTYMGHASITITIDRYGHLLPGNEQQAARLLDLWLQNAATHD